jgi:cytochrome c-type biogenesis protein
MLAQLMESLGRALYDSFPVALGASFAWGLMSMVLSPCHLVSVPLVLGQDSYDSTGSRKFKLALLFALGMTLSIAVIGLLTSLMGRIAGDIGTTGNTIMAVLLIYVGISISGLLNLPIPGAGSSPKIARKGMAGALIMGLVLGAALGPCTFAFMAPVLALMFSMGSQRLAQAVSLGVLFAIGHGLVVVLAGSYTDKVQKLLDWSGSSRTAKSFRVVCGFLVVIGGLYLLYGSL